MKYSIRIHKDDRHLIDVTTIGRVVVVGEVQIQNSDRIELTTDDQELFEEWRNSIRTAKHSVSITSL